MNYAYTLLLRNLSLDSIRILLLVDTLLVSVHIAEEKGVFSLDRDF